MESQQGRENTFSYILNKQQSQISPDINVPVLSRTSYCNFKDQSDFTGLSRGLKSGRKFQDFQKPTKAENTVFHMLNKQQSQISQYINVPVLFSIS